MHEQIDYNTDRSVVTRGEQAKYEIDKMAIENPTKKRKNTIEIYIHTQFIDTIRHMLSP